MISNEQVKLPPQEARKKRKINPKQCKEDSDINKSRNQSN